MIRLYFVKRRKPFCALEVLIPVGFRVIVLEAVNEGRDFAAGETARAVLLLREDDRDVLLHEIPAEARDEAAVELRRSGCVVVVSEFLDLGEEGVVLQGVA